MSTAIQEHGPDTREAIRQIIADEMGIDIEDITDNAHFIDDLNMDSLDYVEMIMRCEEEFEIQINEDEDEVTDHETVGKFVAFIEQKVGQ